MTGGLRWWWWGGGGYGDPAAAYCKPKQWCCICQQSLHLDVRVCIYESAAPSDLTARNLFDLPNQNKCRWTGFTAPHLGFNQPRWNRNRFCGEIKIGAVMEPVRSGSWDLGRVGRWERED